MKRLHPTIHVLLVAFGLTFLALPNSHAQPLNTNNDSNTAGSGTTVTLPVTTGANETIKLATIASSGSPTSVVPSGCATWTQRYAGASGTAFISLYEASVVAALTSCTVTVTASGGTTPGGWVTVYGSFSGVNAVVNDTSFAVAKQNTGTSSLPTSATFSTSQAHDALLAIEFTRGATALNCGILTGGSGTWNNVKSRNAAVSGGVAVVFNYSQVSVVQSSIAPVSTNASCTSLPSTWVVVTDALTADTPVTGRSRLIQ